MFVGGDFLEAGGLPASRIARWEFPVASARGALLAGQATDDGLPTDSTLSFLWTQVNGPGLVTFSNATNATTRAGFSAVGTYVLRLAASDSDLTGFDEVTIVVRGNEPPNVSAGPDQTIGLTESIVSPARSAMMVCPKAQRCRRRGAGQWASQRHRDVRGRNRDQHHGAVQCPGRLLRLTANDFSSTRPTTLSSPLIKPISRRPLSPITPL
jgi:hypothetical protein